MRPDDDLAVVRDIHWTVEPGDWWVIAGSHGSGKSALLQTLAGLIPLGAGELTVFGESITATSRRAGGWHREVALVFEGGGRLLRDLTVIENIALPLGYHRNLSPVEAVEAVIPLVQALELDRLAEASAGRIGRAWSQRVALGRALAVGPELLLLDNPLAGMDRYHLSWWRQFLARLAQGHPILGSRPLTLVVTADDPRPWVEPHRKAALIDDGRWRLVGTLGTAQAEHSATFTDWLQPD